MKTLTLSNLAQIFKDRRVAIIGSAPSARDNTAKFIDGHDEIIRINNFKTVGTDLRGHHYDYRDKVGYRTDWHYSFYGGSIRTKREDLIGIKGHLCKCPDKELVHRSQWHEERGLRKACGWAWIYRARTEYWQAPVYIPKVEHYMKCFEMLGGHVPSTGFACIWEFVNLPVKSMYVTGFDFFRSGIHNIDEQWRPGKKDDPIRHIPEKEFEIFKRWAQKMPSKIQLDYYLRKQIIGK